MVLKALLRARIKASRKRGALWVTLLDIARQVATSEGRGLLLTKITHRGDVHQTTPYTCEDRYPELFELAAALLPNGGRIWSFGCSTGEELVALRRRFPEAEIVGSEINRRSRRIAERRVAEDDRTTVVRPSDVEGTFDLIFALAVLQREPHKIAEMGVEDLTPYYPFERFDRAVGQLVEALRPNGLLCVVNAQYRIEDSSSAKRLEPVASSPRMEEPLFGPNGRRLRGVTARTVFRRA